VTGASATRRPNRFETASMAAAALCTAGAAGLDLASAPNTANPWGTAAGAPQS